MRSDYEAQAQAWATKWGVVMTCTFAGHRRYFADDKDTRDTYSITLRRGNRSMTFDYGASLNGSRACADSDGPYWRERLQKHKGPLPFRRSAPSHYDVLTCIEKYEPGTFEQWCGELGYDTDSRKALDTYLAVQKQAREFVALCGSDRAMMEEAQEIQ